MVPLGVKAARAEMLRAGLLTVTQVSVPLLLRVILALGARAALPPAVMRMVHPVSVPPLLGEDLALGVRVELPLLVMRLVHPVVVPLLLAGLAVTVEMAEVVPLLLIRLQRLPQE